MCWLTKINHQDVVDRPDVYFHKKNCDICAIKPHNYNDCPDDKCRSFITFSESWIECDKCPGNYDWQKFSYKCRTHIPRAKCPKCGTQNENKTYWKWRKQTVHPLKLPC